MRANGVDDVLERRDWTIETAPARALGWTFAVRANDESIGRTLARIVEPLVDDGATPMWYSIVSSVHHGSPRHRLYRGAARILDCGDAVRTVRHVLWDVNQQAFRRTPDRILVHAAAASAPEGAIVLPGASGAGKSTLVAGLVGRGLDYISDEIAAIDPATGWVTPYPKAISLKDDARDVLAHLRPDVPSSVATPATPWEIVPGDIRRGAIGRDAPIRWVVLPSFASGAQTSLVDVPRAEALGAVVDQVPALSRLDGERFAALASVVRGARCARLVSGDLTTACDAVLTMVANPG